MGVGWGGKGIQNRTSYGVREEVYMYREKTQVLKRKLNVRFERGYRGQGILGSDPLWWILNHRTRLEV